MTQPFRVSLSAYQTWQTCQQKYNYRYVKRIRPIVKNSAPQRGTVIHEYMDVFYSALKDGRTVDDAHELGIQKLESHKLEFELAASVSRLADQPEEAEEYAQMLVQCVDLAERYLNMHGRVDAERYDILLVEERLRVMTAPDILSTGIVDLVLRDRIHGRVAMLEHKTTKTVPRASVRLRDFQTLLYAEKLRATHGVEIDSVLWNYVRTEPPTIPRVLKNGKMSTAANIDSTWDVYEKALLAAGLDPADYADMRASLTPRERTVYFPRYEHVIVASSDVLLFDYVQTSTTMRRAVWEWRAGKSVPSRSLARSCDWCEFYKLCEAEVMGGDADDLIKRFFIQDERINA